MKKLILMLVGLLMLELAGCMNDTPEIKRLTDPIDECIIGYQASIELTEKCVAALEQCVEARDTLIEQRDTCCYERDVLDDVIDSMYPKLESYRDIAVNVCKESQECFACMVQEEEIFFDEYYDFTMEIQGSFVFPEETLIECLNTLYP